MSAIVGWIIGIPLSIAISWLVWYVWNNNRMLDARIANGDIELLSSSNYNITEVVRAPAGSRVEKVAQQIVAPVAGGYIRQTLPDGIVALIPVASVPQPIKSYPNPTHTTQLQQGPKIE